MAVDNIVTVLLQPNNELAILGIERTPNGFAIVAVGGGANKWMGLALLLGRRAAMCPN